MANQKIICSEQDPREIYKLMIGCIGPRPIGWISTISSDGTPNLAPYSFFNMFSMNPVIIGFSASIRRDDSLKDSLLNVRQTKCFVHNVATEDLVEPMNASAEEFPYGVNEFEKVGLTTISSELIPAPRVLEAAISIECKLMDIVSLGAAPGNGQLVLGEVLIVHVHRPEVLSEDGFVKSGRLKLVSRLGRTDYMRFGEVLSLSRP